MFKFVSQQALLGNWSTEKSSSIPERPISSVVIPTVYTDSHRTSRSIFEIEGVFINKKATWSSCALFERIHLKWFQNFSHWWGIVEQKSSIVWRQTIYPHHDFIMVRGAVMWRISPHYVTSFIPSFLSICWKLFFVTNLTYKVITHGRQMDSTRKYVLVSLELRPCFLKYLVSFRWFVYFLPILCSVVFPLIYRKKPHCICHICGGGVRNGIPSCPSNCKQILLTSRAIKHTHVYFPSNRPAPARLTKYCQ